MSLNAGGEGGIDPDVVEARMARANARTIDIEVRLTLIGAIWVVDPDGERIERASFGVLKVGDFWTAEEVCRYEAVVPGRGKFQEVDFNELRRVMARMKLERWTLGEVKRLDGWVEESCWRRIARVQGTVMDAFMSRYEQSFMVTDKEEAVIDRQCAGLFRKNSKGVTNPCEAVSLFCALGNMWEKFGTSWGASLKEMPYREYRLLRMVMDRESDARARDSAVSKVHPGTKIAGAGGRTRPSRGQKVPM